MKAELVARVEKAIMEATGYSVRGENARAAAEAACQEYSAWAREQWRKKTLPSELRGFR